MAQLGNLIGFLSSFLDRRELADKYRDMKIPDSFEERLELYGKLSLRKRDLEHEVKAKQQEVRDVDGELKQLLDILRPPSERKKAKQAVSTSLDRLTPAEQRVVDFVKSIGEAGANDLTEKLEISQQLANQRLSELATRRHLTRVRRGVYKVGGAK